MVLLLYSGYKYASKSLKLSPYLIMLLTCSLFWNSIQCMVYSSQPRVNLTSNLTKKGQEFLKRTIEILPALKPICENINLTCIGGRKAVCHWKLPFIKVETGVNISQEVKLKGRGQHEVRSERREGSSVWKTCGFQNVLLHLSYM